MTKQADNARAFAAMHIKGDPVVLWNIWDAGSARAVVEAGASAVATGSWSVAAALGHDDGEDLPMGDALRAAAQIVAAVDVPVSVDFESGYSADPATVGAHAAELIATGAVGLNLEDRIICGSGLFDTTTQAAKITAVRAAADAAGVPFYINARTDVFLGEIHDDPGAAVADVLARAVAYADAGASGLFVPGLLDLGRIAEICAGQPLPVNVLRMGEDAPGLAALADAGVARISHGPDPYRAMVRWIAASAET
ncbi:MAG: isocitrate lyase/phosphoenolpyruvate mutase family protein [Pseudomonadota bacterium]